MIDGTFKAKTAADWENDFKRFAKMRNPNAKTGPGEYLDLAAKNVASMLMYSSNDALQIAAMASLQDKTGTQLDDVGRPVSEGGIGLPRPGAKGAAGVVTVATVNAGSSIEAGDELLFENGVAYQCAKSKRYFNGETLTVTCKETGPGTNLPVGSQLVWSSPRPGCFANAVVSTPGLIGGREAMEDDEYRELLADALANPATSDNDALLHKLIMDSSAHGVPVERSFTIPCIRGAATTAFTFTMKGTNRNASRCPSFDLINTVGAYIEQQINVTDGIFKIPLESSFISCSFRVSWLDHGWADSMPWPPYRPLATRYVVTEIGTAYQFTVGIVGGNYTGAQAPAIGQSIGFFTSDARVVRKVISNVSGAGPWLITCETGAESSDGTYVPGISKWVMPWSDSLQTIADLTLEFVNKMGPGQAISVLPDESMRMARIPEDMPNQWPSKMNGALLGKILSLSNVRNAKHEDGADFETPVGGLVTLYLARLASFAVYPL
jgi:uncharacterized phage protein gp47/JayE